MKLDDKALVALDNLVEPEYRDELVRWTEQGIAPTSKFLQAILCNDLGGALVQVRGTTTAATGIVRWLHEYAPALCWGSCQRYLSWRSVLEGLVARGKV